MNLCLVGLNSKSTPLGKFRANVINKLIFDKNEISKCSRILNKIEIEHQKLATLSCVTKSVLSYKKSNYTNLDENYFEETSRKWKQPI
jgi:hypothetical protein